MTHNVYRGCQTGRRFLDRVDRGSAWGNRQEATREELLETLHVTLAEALEFNRQEARGAAGQGYKKSYDRREGRLRNSAVGACAGCCLLALWHDAPAASSGLSPLSPATDNQGGL